MNHAKDVEYGKQVYGTAKGLFLIPGGFCEKEGWKGGAGMSTLQAELIDMTKDLSEDAMKLLIGLIRQLVIPMDERVMKQEKISTGRIGFMKETDIIEPGYDIDELNPEIAKLFGVEEE